MFSLLAAVALAPVMRMQTTTGILLRHFQDAGQADRIVVGAANGDVYGFDAKTGEHAWTLPGGGSPVRDVCRVQGRLFWFEKDSNDVRCVDADFAPIRIPMGANGLSGTVTALDAWRGMLVVQTDQGLRVVDPQTLKVSGAQDLFPRDIAAILEQGPCKFLWRTDRGLIVSFRHYGTYNSPPEVEGVKAITLLNAWSCDSKGKHRFLGGYTAGITEYRDTAGPRVSHRQGETMIDLPHGHSDLGNVTVGPEGVVAALKRRVLTIPFAKNGWQAGEATEPKVAPDYAAGSALAGSNVWFKSGKRWTLASLEDGDCTVLVPRNGEIRQVAADESGAYVLTDRGVSRVDPDDDSSLKRVGMVAYEMGAGSELSSEQRKLHDAMKRGGANDLKGVLQAAKLTAALKRLPKAFSVASLEYGDLVTEKGRTRIYVGNGEVAAPGSARAEVLRIGDGVRFTRILAPDMDPSAYAVTAGPGLLGYVSPIGINRPLAPGAPVARVVPGAAFDRPFLPGHYTLAGLIPDWIGTPYVWGGSLKGEGCDCSGFVQGVFREMGIGLPRYSQDIGRARRGMIVTGELHYGDVLVFPSPKHVAIYIGDGRTAEAVRGGVGYSSIYRRRLAVVRRFIL